MNIEIFKGGEVMKVSPSKLDWYIGLGWSTEKKPATVRTKPKADKDKNESTGVE